MLQKNGRDLVREVYNTPELFHRIQVFRPARLQLHIARSPEQICVNPYLVWIYPDCFEQALGMCTNRFQDIP